MTPLETLLQPLIEATQLEFSPVGKVQISGCTKNFIAGPRPHNKTFEQYPDDNIAVTFLQLEDNYIVVDIDGSFSHADDDYIYLEYGQTLPLTLYTHTSCNKKAHLYYRRPDIPLPTRTESVVAPKVDTFTYGTLFEGHGLNASVHSHPIQELPQDHPFILRLQAYGAVNPTSISNTGIYPVSRPLISNAVTQLLDIMDATGKIPINRTTNKYLRAIIPSKYIKKGARNLIKDIDFNYTFVNSLAAKLAGVSEISTEQNINFIRKFIEVGFGLDPDYKNKLSKNIFATIQWRDAIEVPTIQDIPTIEELKKQQLNPELLILKTSMKNSAGESKVSFIALDPITNRPYTFNRSYYFTRELIESIAPWRQITNEEGKVIGWDDRVPLVESHHSPYHPPVDVNEENERLRINLYTPTIYQENVMPRKFDLYNSDNIVFKFLTSSIAEEYLDYTLLFLAHAIFSDNPPTTILCYASNTQGSGKSALTLKIPNKLIGSAINSSSANEALSGWGDVVKGKRILALEDIGKLSNREWTNLYDFMKRQADRAHRLINNKGGSMESGVVKLSLTVSSNYPPRLDADDRRFFCLEPAHLDSSLPNKPLSDKEASTLDTMLDSEEYYEEFQELADHLYYIYLQPLSPEQYNSLKVRAPVTKYKTKWQLNATSYIERIAPLVHTNPDGLLSLVRDSGEFHSTVSLNDLIRYIIHQYKPTTGKMGLPYTWFMHFVKYVEKDKTDRSKQSLQDAMGVEFAHNIGNTYKTDPILYGVEWKAAGLLLEVTNDVIDRYKELLIEMDKNTIGMI